MMLTSINILPINDLLEHDESDECDCHPKVEYDGEGVKIIIHNSYDGREYFEKFTVPIQ